MSRREFSPITLDYSGAYANYTQQLARFLGRFRPSPHSFHERAQHIFPPGLAGAVGGSGVGAADGLCGAPAAGRLVAGHENLCRFPRHRGQGASGFGHAEQEFRGPVYPLVGNSGERVLRATLSHVTRLSVGLNFCSVAELHPELCDFWNGDGAVHRGSNFLRRAAGESEREQASAEFCHRHRRRPGDGRAHRGENDRLTEERHGRHPGGVVASDNEGVAVIDP